MKRLTLSTALLLLIINHSKAQTELGSSFVDLFSLTSEVLNKYAEEHSIMTIKTYALEEHQINEYFISRNIDSMITHRLPKFNHETSIRKQKKIYNYDDNGRHFETLIYHMLISQ